jgi:hypothetical protein
MTDSPPPSPGSIFKAQLIVEEARLANSKVKKGKKNSAILATAKPATKKAVGHEEGQELDKENVDLDGIKYILLYIS